MSNSYYSYRGAGSQPSAADLRQVAEAAQSDAEIATIADGDSTRQQQTAEYGVLANATLTAAQDLPGDVRHALATHLDKVRAITTAGESLRRGIPTPRMSGELAANPHARQHVYDAARLQTVTASAEQIVTQATQGLEAEAAAITHGAWLAAVPPTPDRALSGRVEASVTAVHAAIAGGAKPGDILQRAIDAGDRVLVHALLGSQEGKSLLTALGVDRAALAKTYGEHLLAQGASFPGAAFLKAQSDPARSLAALHQRALAVYHAQRDRAAAVLRTRAVRGA